MNEVRTRKRTSLHSLEEEFEMGVEWGILDKVNSRFFFPLGGTLPSEKQSKALTVVSALGNVSTPLRTDHSHFRSVQPSANCRLANHHHRPQ